MPCSTHQASSVVRMCVCTCVVLLVCAAGLGCVMGGRSQTDEKTSPTRLIVWASVHKQGREKIPNQTIWRQKHNKKTRSTTQLCVAKENEQKDSSTRLIVWAPEHKPGRQNETLEKTRETKKKGKRPKIWHSPEFLRPETLTFLFFLLKKKEPRHAAPIIVFS